MAREQVIATTVEMHVESADEIRTPIARSHPRQEALVWIGRIVLIGALVGTWQLASGRWISRAWFSSPALIGSQIWEWIGQGVLLTHVRATVLEMAIGFVLGTPFAVAAAFVLGSYRGAAEILEPIIIALYNIPKLALAPLLILWFGIDMTPKIVLVALVTFFLMFVNIYSGIRDVDRDLVNVVRVMGASPFLIFVKVMLPSAIPWILTGVKITLPYALTAAVAGEMMVSREGLGHLLAEAALMIDMTGVYAALAVLMLIGVLVDAAVGGSRASITREESRETLQA